MVPSQPWFWTLRLCGSVVLWRTADSSGSVGGLWTSSYHHRHHELEGPLRNAFFYASSRSTFRLNFHFQSGLRFYPTLMMGPNSPFRTLNFCSLARIIMAWCILINDVFAGASNPFIRIFLSCPYLCSGYFVFFFPIYFFLHPLHRGVPFSRFSAALCSSLIT